MSNTSQPVRLEVGEEVTESPCCGAMVTYFDDTLICKLCFEEV